MQSIEVMSLNSHYQKIKYLNAIKDLLREFYSTEDSESPIYQKAKSKLDGFSQAGVVIGIVSKSELQDIIDQEHMDAFGITRKQRRAELKLDKKATEVDWGIYDPPTIHRRK